MNKETYLKAVDLNQRINNLKSTIVKIEKSIEDVAASKNESFQVYGSIYMDKKEVIQLANYNLNFIKSEMKMLEKLFNSI